MTQMVATCISHVHRQCAKVVKFIETAKCFSINILFLFKIYKKKKKNSSQSHVMTLYYIIGVFRHSITMALTT